MIETSKIRKTADEVDEWDRELVKEAQEALKESDFIPLEDVLKETGLSAKNLPK